MDKLANSPKSAVWIACGLALILSVFAWYWMQNRSAVEKNSFQVQQIVNSEELLLDLTKKLKHLSRSVLNLQLPDPQAKSIFDENIELIGTPIMRDFGDVQIDETSRIVAKKSLAMWQPIFATCMYFENAKFYNIEGRFVDDAQNRYSANVGFAGLASTQNGKFTNLHAELEIEWTRDLSGENRDNWLIKKWHLKNLTLRPVGSLYFEDVLPKIVTDKKDLGQVTFSKHAKLTSYLVNGGDHYLPEGVEYPFFFTDVTLEHPGVSVVDIDQDGFEDIFIAMQHESNLLFHNQGNGTFKEAAREFGLDIKGDCTCAIFADFDNDSDPDVFIGRGRQPSQYLINDGGKFVVAPDLVNIELPVMVSSISTADYNADGLLDVYLSTYSPIEAEYQTTQTPKWVELFLNDDQASEYLNRQSKAHPFLARTGPPNLLLTNTGNGRFEVSKLSPQLELWKMTFQASWHDFDADGDPDLYVCNDYHRDNFFRNDEGQGFIDVTDELGLTEMGFGMGVSFGDYDNDGQTDIYVSNMFSKAGRRILAQVDNVDTRFQELANGNFLYQKQNAKYELVSGIQKDKIAVAKAGWSWGGQFADFDNDGFRDLYVVNGYYTAPDDIAKDVDL